MTRKVHNEGQVVIPAHVRKQLGIEPGDVLEMEVIAEEGRIELRLPAAGRAATLAGSLKRYARGKRFPTEREMAEALREGFSGGG